ncbi:MAG: ATP-binding protein [Candidatus Dadabacteria bacterium]|nr:ATP-binding protein [Candidatus Dadabacteria bacterium]
MLNDVVEINEHFKRSVNIKSDLLNRELLEGYICPKSSEEALIGLVKHIKGTGQSSFTWTGPYGSGKSSLVLLLSSVVSQDNSLREMAYSRLSEEAQQNIHSFFGKRDWKVLPVLGEPASTLKIIGHSMVINGFCKTPPDDNQTLISIIENAVDKKNGIAIFIDEMGKFLESFSNGQPATDVYLFQQLAELANSSDGRIVLIGILHQSFNEYARNLSRIVRDEWTKIQGRFVDYRINTVGEEQLELISKAIVSKKKPKRLTVESKETAAVIKKNRPINEKAFSQILNACWPLHPVVATLLGPVSRRRFGQNQRSIFSFLNSAELGGFKEFLNSTKPKRTSYYYPDYYWDYIQINLESSIIASSDAKLWALANDSLARCEAMGGSEEHLRLLKTIAVIDIFKGHSGLAASWELLKTCGFEENLPTLLKDLKKWSLVRFKKYNGFFSIFEGSDFDLETAIDEALKNVDSVSFEKLAEIASFKPFVAKRHYHITGALRWMDVNILPVDRVEDLSTKTREPSGVFGGFFIIVPTNIDEYEHISKQIKNLSGGLSENKNYVVVCGISEEYETILSYSKELLALEWIEKNRNEMLDGDSVARREVETRKTLIKSLLEELLSKQIGTISWIKDGEYTGVLSHRDIIGLVSDIADQVFKNTPIVKSEMLNRDRPSSNANAALNALLRILIVNNGEKRLGINGYPPEGGLFKALIEDSSLYKEIDGTWLLQEPENRHKFRFNLLWQETDRILSGKQSSVPLKNLYNAWQTAPYGLKSGLLPFFATVYLMTRCDKVALYLNETYRPSFDDLSLDYLIKTPQAVSLRWVDYDELGLEVLKAVKKAINAIELNGFLIDKNATAFDVARSLVSLVDSLNPWVHRTRRLSKETIRFREIVKTAHDPNKLLFDDLPDSLDIDSAKIQDADKLQNLAEKITNFLVELTEAYPSLLKEFGLLLSEELQVGITTSTNIKRLRERAQSIRGATGDFRIDALATRLSSYDGTLDDIAGIASLAANKPVKDWIDLDVDRAKQEIVSLCYGFKKAELLARVQGRKTNRHSLALITALSGEEEIYDLEFNLLDDKKETILKLKKLIHQEISTESVDAEIAIAAIAELAAEYIRKIKEQPKRSPASRKIV